MPVPLKRSFCLITGGVFPFADFSLSIYIYQLPAPLNSHLMDLHCCFCWKYLTPSFFRLCVYLTFFSWTKLKDSTFLLLLIYSSLSVLISKTVQSQKLIHFFWPTAHKLHSSHFLWSISIILSSFQKLTGRNTILSASLIASSGGGFITLSFECKYNFYFPIVQIVLPLNKHFFLQVGQSATDSLMASLRQFGWSLGKLWAAA